MNIEYANVVLSFALITTILLIDWNVTMQW